MKHIPFAAWAAPFSFCLFLPAMTLAQDWQLVWSDEFDSPGLPDASKWGYDVGGGGWGNGELEYYTDSRLENASVANGVLSITARKESYGGMNYTSARMVTAGKGDWLYGRVEVKAKLPRGRGMWPAIWLLPTDWEYGNWPASGELDMMENVGYDSTRVHSNIHTEAYNHTIGTNKGNNVELTDPWGTWHVYRMDWYPDSISYWVDDTHIFSFSNEYNDYTTWPFDKRFHLVLNIAVGGSWGGAQGVDDSRFPQSMQVDYVRVYQLDGMVANPPVAPPEGELVWNGDFAQGTKVWQPLGAYEGAAARGEVVNEEYHATVTAAGTNDWNVQFDQEGLTFEQGKTYEVSFRARASLARSIAVAGNQTVDPWTTYGKDTLQITTAMQSYSFQFTMEQPTDTNARIEFDLGGVVSEVWLDDVSVHVAGGNTGTLIRPITHSAVWAPLRHYDLLGRNIHKSW